jgi:thiopurine S-methyltransferase
LRQEPNILWLREQGHELVGVEICQLAVEAFFAESGLQASVTKHGAFNIHQTEGLRLYCRDFFQMTSEDMAGVSAVFDRASLIALPPSMRSAYVAHMQTILALGVNTLLVTSITFNMKCRGRLLA